MISADPPTQPSHIVIAGGGVGAPEAAPALREFGAEPLNGAQLPFLDERDRIGEQAAA